MLPPPVRPPFEDSGRRAEAPGRSRRDRRRAFLLLACAAILLSRAPFVPSTLEDIDSVNFALALERFDPSLHQPHPPGYPVFVALAGLVYAGVPEAPRALGLLSAMAQAALVFPLFALFSRLSSTADRAALSTLLVFACPVLWFNGARPMSDSVGLLFVTATQALLLRSLETRTTLPAASFLAGLSLGLRLQTGLLTVPLWLWALRQTRTFWRPVAALALGIAPWAVWLIISSGGFAEYARVFRETMGDAAASEPLLSNFTLNRVLRALFHLGVAPWVSPVLGLSVGALAALGLASTAARRRGALGLASLAFLPYAMVHALVQQGETVRYSLPYIPWIAWLAVEGLGWLADRFSRPALMERAVLGGFVTASAALTIPALALYQTLPSPPYAALRQVEARAAAGGDFLLAGHYMFSRYFDLRPAGLDLLTAAPGKAIPRLVEHFRSGDDRTVLFLADPHRTDLDTFSRPSPLLLGRWEWPLEVRPFLSGERPDAAELFAVRPPRFLTGEGWRLSLDSGPLDEIAARPVREAFLRPMTRPGFLLIAGGPTGPTPGCTLNIEIPELIGDTTPCREPLLRGYPIRGQSAGPPYLQLSATTRQENQPTTAPLALWGLDYVSENEPGFVHGEGWFAIEKDEDSRVFRWASPSARSLLHIPPAGARLVIEGTAPLGYLGAGLGITVSENGATLLETRLRQEPFRLVIDLAGGGAPLREILLSADRSFVPDTVQWNGDRRRLALRVYRFSLDARGPTP